MTNLSQKLGREIRTAVVGGLAVLGAVGCSDSQKVLPDVTREEFNNYAGAVLADSPDSSFDELYIKDINGDGQADVLAFGPRAYWIAFEYKNVEGQEPKSGYLTDDARIMTHEMREAATRALKADQDLAYLIAKENHRLSLQGGSK